MTRLGPAGRAELRAEHEYRKAHSQLSRDIIAALDDLTAQLAAKDAEIAALKAAAPVTITDAMVETAAKAIVKEIQFHEFGRYDAGKWVCSGMQIKALKTICERAALTALTAASLAPGTRADGLRRAAEIVRTWAGGLDDKSVHRACERIAAEINAEIEKEIRSDDYGDRFEIGKGALRTIVTGDLDAKTAHAIAQAGLDVMEHGVDVCRKIRGDA